MTPNAEAAGFTGETSWAEYEKSLYSELPDMELPGTFVVSGPIIGTNLAKIHRRGYLFRTRTRAYEWCIARYGAAYFIPDVPGWMWAFRVPLPETPLERDENLSYHLGFGEMRK
jgi:hypothetical protein